MIGEFLKRIFGSKNERELRSLSPIVDRINQLEIQMKRLSDDKLRAKTAEFKQRLENGESLDNLLPEAFAVVREASVRTLGLRPFDVQLIGGIVLHQGKIAEMKTGEGKTLVATMPLYLNALTGRGVHLVTVNDYLAKRDAEWMGSIYKFLGMSVGVIVHGMDDSERKRAYACDITYGTNNEFGFDYLRDNMKYSLDEMVQREFYYAIVDEVDSILIDEARTPLIISGPVEHRVDKIYMEVKPHVLNLRKKQASIIRRLLREVREKIERDEIDEDTIKKLVQIKRGDPKNPLFLKILADNPRLKKEISKMEAFLEIQKMLPELDQELYCIVDEQSSSVDLTDKGIKLLSNSGLGDFTIPDIDEEAKKIQDDPDLSEQKKAEKLRELEERYVRSSELLHAVQQLIRAYWLFEKDVHYVVKDGQIVIVDEFTGRMLPGRRWSDGLHQAVEAKEGVKVEEENQTLATITFQNFFRMYEKLAGMTGTADTEAEEFKKIYNLDVVVIPTHMKMIRKDYPDVIYKTEKEKFKAVVEEIKECYKRGQPVLVGTTSIEKSEMLSKMLKRAGIPHSVLNAKHHEKEAEIIAKAGQKHTVTISTNMAGRGTDIVLGEGVSDLGGLHVIGTERHESRRIDNQLRGRSGRQGDPGSSRFYLSLEDDLLRIFGSERIASVMERLGIEEGEPIEHPLITKAIENAQKRVEAYNFSIRKQLLEYDDVMNKHREIIYGLRRKILEGKDIDELILNMIEDKVEDIVERYTDPKKRPEEWDIKGIEREFLRIFAFRPKIEPEDIGEERFSKLSVNELREMLISQTKERYADKKKLLGEESLSEISKLVLLNIIDKNWVDHLEDMEFLKESIGLRGYGQLDPLKEYQKEGFAMFESLLERIKEETLNIVFSLRLVKKAEEIPKRERKVLYMRHGDEPSREPIKKQKKIGRNDPCPCGSGKKYKKCCGRGIV